MTGKVTNEQASKANISIEDFRKAVNKVNPKNKGYVRFVPDGRGGVTIAKVNNKIDFKISWRTNIDEAHNRTMREKFALAMANDLRWADRNSVQKLVDSITNVRQKDGGKRTDALSRKELEKAFQGYDRMMNTPFGRMQMLDNLLKATAERCNLAGTDDGVKALKEKYLKLSKEMGDLSLLWEADLAQEGNAPKMDELTFKTMLHELENLCDEAVKRAEIETLFKDKADPLTGAKALDNTFGLHLSQEETSQLRGALLHFLSIKGLAPQQDEGGVVGTGGMIFEKFMTDVLPALFKRNVESMREWSNGENGDKALQMEANFSFEAIMEEAEKFMLGARQFIDNPPDVVVKSTGDARFDKIVEGGKETVKGARQMAINSAMQKDALGLIENTAITEEEGKRIHKDLQGARKAYMAEGLLDTFTKNFLAEHGIGDSVAEDKQASDAFQNTMEAITKDTYKLGTAIRIQNGTVRKNAETGRKELVDEGMGAYVHDMENAISQIASGKDGMDMALVSKLMTFTMANLATRKVEMVANGIGTNLKLDKTGEEKDKELLRSTAEAYFSFEKNVGKTIAKATTSFEKMVRAQIKKGLVDEATANDMLLRAQSKFAHAHKAALQGFFLKSPIADANEGKQLLDRIFKGTMQQAISELNNDLAVNSIGRALGVQEKGALMRVEERVAEALAQVGLNSVKLGVDGVISEPEARARLAGGELKSLYSRTLASMLKKLPKVDGHVTVTERFVEKVQSEFNSKVMSLMKNVAKMEANYMKECKDKINQLILDNVSEGRGIFKGYVEGDSPITDSEKKALAKEMTEETMRFKASQIKAGIREILDAPGSFDTKAVQKMASQTVADDGVEKTSIAVIRVAEDRKQMVNEFLADGKNLDKVGQAVHEGKVFGQGGVLANVPKGAYSEGEALMSKATDIVVARVKKMPLVYATGDKEALVKRMAEETDKQAQGFAKKWATFRADFLRQIGPIEDDFSSLGAQKLNDARQWVLFELASRKDFDSLDMKMALGYYRNLLQEHLDGKISEARTRFDEYAAKVTAVHAEAMSQLQGTLDLAKDMIVFAASDEAKQYFADVIIPKMRQRIEYQIYQNPDNFTQDKLEARNDELMKSFVDVAEKVFGGADYKLKSGLNGLIRHAGADVLLQDKVEAGAAMDDLRKWIASPEGHKMRVEAEKAMLDHIMDYGDAFDEKNPQDFAPTGPGNAVAEFRFAARDLLRGHTAQLLYSAFDNEKVGEVREAFKTWLDSHGLSRFEDYRNTTAQERIMAKFGERVKALQQNALNGGENEPILTPAFIEQIDRIIDADGTSMLLAEVKTKYLNIMLEEFAAKDEAVMFNPDDPRFATLSSNLQETVRRNYEDLLGAVSYKITEVLGRFDTQDGLDSVKEAVKGLDDETVRKEIIGDVLLAVEDCMIRYHLEEASTSMVRDYTHTMERELIKGAIGDEKADSLRNGFIDLATHPKVPEKNREALNKELARISDGYSRGISMGLDNCRQHNATVYVLENTFKKITLDFLDIVREDKGWKKVVLPALTTLAKGL